MAKAVFCLLAVAPAILALETAGALRGAPSTASVPVSRKLEEDPMGGDFYHKGCFIDDDNDRVLWDMMRHDAMTPMLCHEHCDGLESAYMALQHGDECWCSYDGNMEYDRHGRGEFGECDMMCGGEDSTTCGGRFAFDLYKLSWPEPEDNGEYVQCFGDLRESRVMDEKAMMIRDDMTVIKCKEHCTKVGGAKFYGLQFGNECWCGKSYELLEYEKYGPGVCHMKCAGDRSTACGGYQAFGLYVLNEVMARRDDHDDDGDDDDSLHE